MPDSSAIENALVAKLLADATLMALMPDGVFIDQSNVGATRFVIVTLVDEHDEAMFQARALEDGLYLVKAVAQSRSGGDVKAAAARIDVLLEQGTLAPAGFTLMAMRRESRVRYTEVDEDDREIRWQHRGGRYQVMVST